jgi:hypothetical protein
VGHYSWEPPVLYTSNTDEQNARLVIRSLPEHIAEAIQVNVFRHDGEVTVLSHYREGGRIFVDIEG